MDYVVAILVVFLALALLASLIGALFMWVGAKLAGVRNSSFGRSISAASGASFATWSIALLASVVSGFGTAAGLLLGIFVSVLVIRSAYDTSLGKAFLVWLFDLLAEALSLAAGMVFLAATIMSLLRR